MNKVGEVGDWSGQELILILPGVTTVDQFVAHDSELSWAATSILEYHITVVENAMRAWETS